MAERGPKAFRRPPFEYLLLPSIEKNYCSTIFLTCRVAVIPHRLTHKGAVTAARESLNSARDQAVIEGRAHHQTQIPTSSRLA